MPHTRCCAADFTINSWWMPIANYDNNQHAEDESIRIQNLWDGIETMFALMLMK